MAGAPGKRKSQLDRIEAKIDRLEAKIDALIDALAEEAEDVVEVTTLDGERRLIPVSEPLGVL